MEVPGLRRDTPQSSETRPAASARTLRHVPGHGCCGVVIEQQLCDTLFLQLSVIESVLKRERPTLEVPDSLDGREEVNKVIP
jgi:hypothetical protein